MPLRSRTTQPQEVTAKDIFHVLVEYTTSDQIQALRERPQMLLYDYKYEASRQDRAAILRHSTRLKHLNTLNTTGVWCFKTLLEAVAKQDASIGRLMAMNPTHGEQAVRINATNLKSMLETCRAIKKASRQVLGFQQKSLLQSSRFNFALAARRLYRMMRMLLMMSMLGHQPLVALGLACV